MKTVKKTQASEPKQAKPVNNSIGYKKIIKDFFYDLQTQLGILGYTTADNSGITWLEYLPQREAVDYICQKLISTIRDLHESLPGNVIRRMEFFLLDIEVRLESIRVMSSKEIEFDYKENQITTYDNAVNWLCEGIIKDVERFKEEIMRVKKFS